MKRKFFTLLTILLVSSTSVLHAKNLNNVSALQNLNVYSSQAILAVNMVDATEFEVIFSVVGDNGSLVATVDNIEITTGNDVEEGKNVVFTATPNPEFQVKEWTLGGAIVEGNTDNEFVVENLDANIVVTVEFMPVPPTTTEYEVVFSVVGDNGSLIATVDNIEITTGNDVEEGKNVVFTATPNPEFQVKEWTLGGAIVEGNTDNEFVVENLDANIVVTVEFMPVPPTTTEYEVVFSVVGDNGSLVATVDEIEITTGNDVEEGKNVVFTATPAEGYQVEKWTMNDVVVEGNTGNEFIVEDLDADIVVTVEFKEAEEEVSKYVVTYSVVDGNGTLVAFVGEDEVESGSELEENTEIVFTASPDEGYKVNNWKINGVVVENNYTNELIIGSLEENTEVSVEFDASPVAHLPIDYAGPFKNELPLGWFENDLANDFTYGPAKFEKTDSWLMVNFQGEPGVIRYNIRNISASGLEWGGTFKVLESSDGETWTEIKTYVGTEDMASNTNMNEHFELESTTRFVKWHFVEKVSGVVGIGNVLITLPLENLEVEFSVVGENGTITAEVDGEAITSGDEVLELSDVVFTATPEENYLVKEWRINDEVVQGENGLSLTIEAIREDVNVTVEFMFDTGIEENLINVSIYPNPTNGQISINSDGVYTMEIVDLQGRVLHRNQIMNGLNNTDISSFAKGVYVVRIIGKNSISTMKISKIE